MYLKINQELFRSFWETLDKLSLTLKRLPGKFENFWILSLFVYFFLMCTNNFRIAWFKTMK